MLAWFGRERQLGHHASSWSSSGRRSPPSYHGEYLPSRSSRSTVSEFDNDLHHQEYHYNYAEQRLCDHYPAREDLAMTPHEVVEHVLAALVQGDIPNHLRYLADDVIWKLNENAAEQGKSGYQKLITAMTRNQDEMIVGFQLDGDHLDLRGRVWIRTLEDHRTRWRDRLGPRECTERVASAYLVTDGVIKELRVTALEGSNRIWTYPPSVTLP
jgi:hypothetical protein